MYRMALLIVASICISTNVAIAAEDTDAWNFNIKTGSELSTFSKSERTASDGNSFSDQHIFVGISGEVKLCKYSIIFTDIVFGKTNIQQNADQNSNELTLIREANVIDADLGMRIVIAENREKSLKYIGVISSGLIIGNQENINQDFLGKTFIGLGAQNTSGFFKDSFFTVGIGRSERFDAQFRPLKSELNLIMDVVNLGNTSTKKGLKEDTWKVFLNLKVDSGAGPDDFRIMYGLQRNIDFLGKIIGTAIGWSGN